MTPLAYYNEHDKYAAQWLRNLIAAGHIAPGFVDERSIEDVKPSDVIGYTQCHWFAGIGVWSYALRRAGWPDDRPVWTGSCPCQPFSDAGAGAGFADERHLWPAWFHLISECRPVRIYGEQVASKAVGPWIDLVQDDLEGLGYAVGAVPFPSAGVGAPHIRDRLYWMGHAVGARLEGLGSGHQAEIRRVGAVRPITAASESGGMADTQRNDHRSEINATDHRQPETDGPADRLGGCGGTPGGLADATGGGFGVVGDAARSGRGGYVDGGVTSDRPGPTNGFWRDVDWLYCRDERWRPIKPGLEPLVTRVADGVVRVRADQGSRTGRLKGYGNAINAEAAIEFIHATL